jgi:hypothetical protein
MLNYCFLLQSSLVVHGLGLSPSTMLGVAIATQIGLAGGLVLCGDLGGSESRIDIMFGYSYSNPNSNRR